MTVQNFAPSYRGKPHLIDWGRFADPTGGKVQGQSRESLPRLIRSEPITRLSLMLRLHSGSALGHLPRRNAPPYERLHASCFEQPLENDFTVRSSLTRPETAGEETHYGMNAEMKEVLEGLLAISRCEYVFTHPTDSTRPLGPWVLETQIGALRKKIKTHPDAGLHGLRHTFLTEAGERTDPFTLQYVAGHDNIKDDYALCSPQANAVNSCLLEAVPCPGRTEAQSRCRIRCSRNCPSQAASVSN